MEKNKKDSLSIIAAILFLILGIILILYPGTVVKFIAIVIGIILILLGISKLIIYLKNKQTDDNINNLIVAIVLIIIGIVTMFLKDAIEFIVRLIIGGWLLYSGVIKLVVALKAKEAGIKTWYIPLISSIVMLACGLYTIIVADMLSMAGGIVLVVYSVAEIVQYIAVPKSKNPDIVK